jgi:hypothetical protein
MPITNDYVYLQSNIKERRYMLSIDWEIRAKERRIENKALKKRIKELKISRDLWKSKYVKSKDTLMSVQKKVESVKKNVQQIMGI